MIVDNVNFPIPACSADIMIEGIRPRGNFLEKTVRVSTDSNYRLVKVVFDEVSSVSKVVSLSNQCVAIIAEEDILCGFMVNIDVKPELVGSSG